MKLTANEIAIFLQNLLSDGRLHTADIEILKAHAGLPNRCGENWQIAEAAAKGVVEQLSGDLKPNVKDRISQWNQPPSWHAVDCLYRWLGHSLALEFPYLAALIAKRSNGTKRWWMALGKADETIDGKVTAICLHEEIADALDMLNI